MRPIALAAALLLAGCAGTSPADTTPAPIAPAPEGNTTADDPAAAPPAPPIGERLPPRDEHFALHANRTIQVVREDSPPVADGTLAEPASGLAFYRGFAGPIEIAPFVSEPFNVPFETTGEFDLRVSFMATAPAAPSFPPGAGFPLVGGWFGTPERYAFFIGAADAPNSLEANKIYTVSIRVPLPPGGFFVRQGETIALHPFLSYQTADNSPVSWVVGGADPITFTLPHVHFNVSAPNAVVILDEAGETGANPAPTGDQNPQPASIPFKVPPEAVYVVLEAIGAPKAGPKIDLDASIRTPSGDVLGAGTSPFERETVVIGPTALANAGRDLVAFVTSGASPAGGTFQVKVTAFTP